VANSDLYIQTVNDKPQKKGSGMKASRISSARKLAAVASEVFDERTGDIAIRTLEEFYKAYRSVLADEITARPYLKGYLTAYDRVTAHEITMLRHMGPIHKAEFGRMLALSGIAHEFIAYDELLGSTLGDDEEKKKKKKEGGKGLTEELEALKKAQDWWKPPEWVETILKSIIDIFL
jgi:hypothetical protein